MALKNRLRAWLTREIKNFFEDYKKLEHKTSVLEEFGGKDDALKIVNKAIEDYKLHFTN